MAYDFRRRQDNDGDLILVGIPTLFRCKNDPDPKNCDIALVGVPHSTGNGTTERDQHLGPRAVRNISAMLRRSHLQYGIDPWKKNKIHDLGDVPFPEANDNEKRNWISVSTRRWRR